MKNYYNILGVGENASHEDIKKSFRDLAKKYHPDTSKEDNSEDKFKDINEAYDTLKDDKKRKEYDFERRNPHRHPFRGRSNNDIFSTVFTYNDFFNKQRGRSSENLSITIKMPLTLEELFKGVKNKARYNRNTVCSDCHGKCAKNPSSKKTCQRCGGAGRLGRRHGIMTVHISCPECSGMGSVFVEPCATCGASGKVPKPIDVEIEVPPGGFENKSQRFINEKGHESIHNPGKFGPLIIDISVLPHETYQFAPDGTTMSNMPIPMYLAVCGGVISVPTLHGPRDIEVSSGIVNGDTYRIPNAGFWNRARTGYSDQVVVFQIEMPINLSESDKCRIKEVSRGSSNYPQYHAILDKEK